MKEHEGMPTTQNNVSLKRSRTYFFIAIIVVVNIIILSSIIIVFFDIPFPVINPHYSPPPLRFGLSYPAPEGIVLVNPDVYVDVTLQSNDTISEGTPVLLTAVGSLSPRVSQNVTQVEVVFEGALPVIDASNPTQTVTMNTVGTPFGSVVLYPHSGKGNYTKSSFGMGGPDLVGSSHIIQWNVQGDYSPTLIILFNSPTNLTQEKVSDIRIHVSPASVLQEERFGHENIVISLALVLFEFGASMMIIRELIKSIQSRTNGSTINDDSINKGDNTAI
jgi:hypothetical protein